MRVNSREAKEFKFYETWRNNDETVYLGEYNVERLKELFGFLFREAKTFEELCCLEHFCCIAITEASKNRWKEIKGIK